jgi:hypothetical protein
MKVGLSFGSMATVKKTMAPVVRPALPIPAIALPTMKVALVGASAATRLPVKKTPTNDK